MTSLVPAGSRLLLACVLVALAGCAADPAPVTDAALPGAAAAPEDFAVEALVRHGRRAPAANEAHRRPGRYVLLADGALHHASGAAPGFPPRVRTLTEGEVEGVWGLATELGLADPDAGAPPPNLELIAVGPTERRFVVALTGGDRRWSFTLPVDDARGDAFMRRLAALAWVSDRPEAPVAVIPKRYDLGPDPYERYRNR